MVARRAPLGWAVFLLALAAVSLLLADAQPAQESPSARMRYLITLKRQGKQVEHLIRELNALTEELKAKEFIAGTHRTYSLNIPFRASQPASQPARQYATDETRVVGFGSCLATTSRPFAITYCYPLPSCYEGNSILVGYRMTEKGLNASTN
ncbi:uncharacterized protein LOC111266019 isoform X3 [Varroa jacobsoni]|uniref:uncharacterized protein LOC111266019 isoform X3 n=1 Tax=Varroa jacobsoni TaxID=62625 RepID=UPI000BF3AEBE|nr:uncharacterized protein LOC111266019 isoform X3 [Varroa jacobsoni]